MDDGSQADLRSVLYGPSPQYDPAEDAGQSKLSDRQAERARSPYLGLRPSFFGESDDAKSDGHPAANPDGKTDVVPESHSTTGGLLGYYSKSQRADGSYTSEESISLLGWLMGMRPDGYEEEKEKEEEEKRKKERAHQPAKRAEDLPFPKKGGGQRQEESGLPRLQLQVGLDIELTMTLGFVR